MPWRRILRVKMRAGCGETHAVGTRAGGQAGRVGAHSTRRWPGLVRKSLVLLKNEGQDPALEPAERVLVAGSAANDLGKQVGGWSLTWQGSETGVVISQVPRAYWMRSRPPSERIMCRWVQGLGSWGGQTRCRHPGHGGGSLCRMVR